MRKLFSLFIILLISLATTVACADQRGSPDLETPKIVELSTYDVVTSQAQVPSFQLAVQPMVTDQPVYSDVDHQSVGIKMEMIPIKEPDGFTYYILIPKNKVDQHNMKTFNYFPLE